MKSIMSERIDVSTRLDIERFTTVQLALAQTVVNLVANSENFRNGDLGERIPHLNWDAAQAYKVSPDAHESFDIVNSWIVSTYPRLGDSPSDRWFHLSCERSDDHSRKSFNLSTSGEVLYGLKIISDQNGKTLAKSELDSSITGSYAAGIGRLLDKKLLEPTESIHN